MYLKNLEILTGDYVWCIGCNRAYKKTEMAWDPWLKAYVCKYDDCRVWMKESFWPYDHYRDEFGWPEIPVEGKRYKIPTDCYSKICA